MCTMWDALLLYPLSEYSQWYKMFEICGLRAHASMLFVVAAFDLSSCICLMPEFEKQHFQCYAERICLCKSYWEWISSSRYFLHVIKYEIWSSAISAGLWCQMGSSSAQNTQKLEWGSFFLYCQPLEMLKKTLSCIELQIINGRCFDWYSKQFVSLSKLSMNFFFYLQSWRISS